MLYKGVFHGTTVICPCGAAGVFRPGLFAHRRGDCRPLRRGAAAPEPLFGRAHPRRFPPCPHSLPRRPERPEMPAGAGRLPGRRAGAPPQPGIYLLRGGGGVPGLGAAAAPPPVEAGQGADPHSGFVPGSAVPSHHAPGGALLRRRHPAPRRLLRLRGLVPAAHRRGLRPHLFGRGRGAVLHPGRHSRRLFPGLRFPPPRRVLGRRD